VSEDEERALVIAEAESWIGTPYHPNADVKGAGIDCGMFPVRVFVDTGMVPPFDPRPYPVQFSMHQKAERYLEIVKTYAHEVLGPPKPGDLVMFKFGHSWSHSGIVTNWPEFIHANPPTCLRENWELNVGLHTREPRFFSIWPKEDVK
jgi:cell wall-associated NlpC family hydrolase